MTSLRLGLLVVLAVSAAARGAAVQDSEVHEMGATTKLTPFDDLDANVLGEESPTTDKSDVNCTKPEKSAAEEQGAKEAEVTNAMASMGVNATSLGPNVTTANKTSSNSSRQEDIEKWAMNKTGVNVSKIGPDEPDATSTDADGSSKAGNSSKSSKDIVAEVAAKDAAENNPKALAKDSKPAEQLVKEFADKDAKNSNASEAKAGLAKTKLSSNATASAEDSDATTAMAGENATDTNITTANVTMSPEAEAAAANASATKAKEQEAVMASMNMTKKDVYKQNGPSPCDTKKKDAPAAPCSATPPPPPEAPSNPPVHVVQAEQELDNDEPKA